LLISLGDGGLGWEGGRLQKLIATTFYIGMGKIDLLYKKNLIYYEELIRGSSRCCGLVIVCGYLYVYGVWRRMAEGRTDC
jgi:hypothetical protein